MSKTNATENEILALIFQAKAIANIADNTATSPATTITVSLHSGDPGEAGTMTTNEITTANYNGYTRVTKSRTSNATSGWLVTGNSCFPRNGITFPAATGGTGTVTHFGIGTGVSNDLMYSGTVTPNIAIANGVTPSLTSASSITED